MKTKKVKREAIVVRAVDILELAKSVIDNETYKIWISTKNGKFNIKSCDEKGIWRKRSEFREALILGCSETFFILSSEGKDSLLELAEDIISECGKENGLIMLVKEHENEKILIASIDKRDAKRKINFEMADIKSTILN
jgi:hypothetical protein